MATAGEIQTNSQGYADSAVAEANAFISNLAMIAAGFSVPNITGPGASWRLLDRIDMEISRLESLKPTKPTDGSEIPVIQYFAPSMTIETNIRDITVPTFNETITLPNIPVPTLTPIDDPGNPPNVSTIILPEKPVIGTLPDVPVLSAYNIPSPPTINFPSFDSTMPVDDLVAPSNTFTFNEIEYQSALLDATKAKLLGDMENGSYGIEPLDEERLWTRAGDRALRDANAKLDELRRQYSARGFPLPTGYLLRAEQNVIDAAHAEINSLNRDIALKRSENYVQARQFTITSATGLEQILINYHSSLMERTLNVQKSVLDAGIAIFNASVARYNVKLEAYKTEASIWKTRIEGELAKLEIYKGELEGIKILTESDRLRMEAYREQIKAITILIELYKTELEASNIEAQIQQLTMMGYKTKVEAYAQRLQGEVAKFSLYEAQLKGNLALVSVFEARVNAYKATVDGRRAEIMAESEKVNAEIAVKKLELEGFLGQISAYKSYVDAVVSKVNAALSAYGHDIDVYGRQSQGVLSAYESGGASERASLNAAVDTERIRIEASKANVMAFLEQVKMRVGAASAGADVYKGLILGAMSAINGLTAITEQTNRTV